MEYLRKGHLQDSAQAWVFIDEEAVIAAAVAPAARVRTRQLVRTGKAHLSLTRRVDIFGVARRRCLHEKGNGTPPALAWRLCCLPGLVQ
jgi:hypothetical protein